MIMITSKRRLMMMFVWRVGRTVTEGPFLLDALMYTFAAWHCCTIVQLSVTVQLCTYIMLHQSDVFHIKVPYEELLVHSRLQQCNQCKLIDCSTCRCVIKFPLIDSST